MKLFFREEGDRGTPVIILHGLYGSSDNWLTIGRKLSRDYHVYIPDQRNHGRSPHDGVHTYEAMTEDLAEFITCQKIGKSIVIGHSMGGKTAMLFAVTYPEMVKKLVVIDIAPKSYLIPGRNNLSQQKLILESLREMEIHREKMITREDQLTFLGTRLGSLMLAQFIMKSVERNRDTGHFRFRINVDTLYGSLNEMVGGVNENWFANHVPVTEYPILFIKGERSGYISEEDIPLIKQIYPAAEIKRIPDAGHWVQADQPELFLKTIENFLGKS